MKYIITFLGILIISATLFAGCISNNQTDYEPADIVLDDTESGIDSLEESDNDSDLESADSELIELGDLI